MLVINIHIGKKTIFTTFFLWAFVAVIAQNPISKKDSSDVNYSNQSITTPFYTTDYNSVTAPVTTLSSDELDHYPTSDIREILNGLIPSGLVMKNGYGPGKSNIKLQVRDMNYAIIVDGMERSVIDMDIQEIESVSVLRGLTAHAMYGSSAKNGAIVFTTKRGFAGEDRIDVNVESGIKIASHLPEWLSSEGYAKGYNQAQLNDGMDPKYSQEDIAGYQSGINGLKYPNEDLYNELFNNTMLFTKANISFKGGNEQTQYFAYLGYTGEGQGAMKIKDNSYDRFNIRGRVDVALTDKIKLHMNVATVFGLRNVLPGQSQTWSSIASYAPNVYPIEIAKDTFGANQAFRFNPIAEQTLKGDIDELSRTVQANFGLDFNLNSITKGLNLGVKGMFDMYDFQQKTDKHGLSYALYQPGFTEQEDGSELMTLTPIGVDVLPFGSGITGTNYFQQVAANVNLSYVRAFGQHKVDGNLIAFIQQKKRRGTALEDNRQNFGLRTAYSFKEKYVADLTLSYTGDMNLSSENRYKLFPSMGIGWILSKENFMKTAKAINFMKIRASYGTMGTYDTNESYLYRTEWYRGIGASFGSAEGATETISTTYMSQYGNEDLSWGTIRQFDIGMEAVLFKSRLKFQLDYYNIIKDGIITTAVISDVIGAKKYYDNINKNKYWGIDGTVTWSEQLKDFNYSIGVNFGYNTSEVLAFNEVNNPYPWMNRTGERVGEIYGFEALGVFKDANEINNAPTQYLGEVQPGNLRYKNLNPEDDDKVEAKTDEKAIGNNTPLFKLGMPVTLKYKNIEFYMLGVGYFGQDINTVNHPYFHAQGEQKYSNYVAQNAWTNGGANPKLTTASSPNDNTVSSHWIQDASFFKIKNIELSIDLSSVLAKKNDKTGCKLFVRATNIYTATSFDTLDPENPYGGVSTFATMSTLTAGLKLSF